MKCALRAIYRCQKIIVLILTISAIVLRVEAKIKLELPAITSQEDRDCFQKDWDAAVAKIKKTDPVFSEMMDALEASEVTHWVVLTHGPTVSYGEDEHYQVIFWNPDSGARFWGTLLCADPVASLVHELYHALDNQAGVGFPKGEGVLQKNRTISNPDTNYIPLSELDATNGENLYRRLNGLCIRTHYGSKMLPASDLVAGVCQTPGAGPCSDIENGCQRGCCWVYGVIKDPKTGGWQACVRDHLTPGECRKYATNGHSSSPWPGLPCEVKFPDAPPCP
jgi:hypothetical protein